MTKRSLMSLALSLLAVFLVVAPGWSQQLGRLLGNAVDQTGSAIPGAAVNLYIAGGASPIATATTNADGAFVFPGIQPVTYDVAVEASGFSRYVVRGVKVDPGQDLNLANLTLEVGTLAESVEVTAESAVLQTTSAEVSNTVTNAQIARLPQLNRSPLALLRTQAGVGSNGRTSTTINGLRVTYNNVTIDGINIQDNFIRTNALDFLPNLLLLDQIAEVNVSTSNASNSSGGGATQVTFTTPSGTNRFRGNLYWFNRNNATAANGFFRNRDGLSLPFLNQNQVGGSLGGPIKKDKLFFYGNYEAFRLRQQSSANRTILTDAARQGIFTYEDTAGTVRQANILQLMNRTVDPVIQGLIGRLPAASQINNFRVGDSRADLLRNTGGYSFNIRQNRTRDNALIKLDYYLTEKHSFAGSYSWNRDINDRPDLVNNYDSVPVVANDADRDLLSLTWRWVASPTVVNTLVGGFNLAPSIFATYNDLPQFFVGNMVFSNPENTFMAQGRFTNTYNLNNTTSWVKGNHNITFGYSGQYMRIQPYNDAGIIPTINVGIGTGQQGLVSSQLPGIRPADLTAANNLLATLAGLQNTRTQTYNVKDRTSGFVPGQGDVRNNTFDMHGIYFQDTWKFRPNFTINAGLRYDYFTVVDERDALALMPILNGGNYISTLLGNYTLDFAGKAVNRPFYNADRNNFAPNLGFAWNVFKDSDKLVIRGGYSMTYVNDSHIQTMRNSVTTNAGLSQVSQQQALSGTLTGNLAPQITPAFLVPRTAAENFAVNRNQAAGMPNPNLVTPYVQQWNMSAQTKLWGGVLEVRYLGNKVTQAFRAFDYNQIQIRDNGFLADFLRGQQNGFLAQAATGTFNPAFNANIAGSQPLTVIGNLPSGGNLANATVRNHFQLGQVGELGAFYVANNAAGNFPFYPNSLALAANVVNNFSNSNYHSAQIDYRRTFSKGLTWQANYVYGKVMSDSAGDGQTSFEAFLDFNNTALERARTPFDITHAFKTNFVYDLPFGEGQRWLNGNAFARKVFGGWSVSGIFTWQSGNPFSVLSERGTLNRNARSTGQNGNTASTLVDKSTLDSLIAVRVTGDGPFYFAPSVTGVDGRAAQPDGQGFFQGQVFFNPGAGQLGGLQRRMFSGPAWYNMDMGIVKTTQITERQSIEFRGEAINAFNTVAWYIGDQSINSVNFGRITSTQSDPRRIQFGLYYRF